MATEGSPAAAPASSPHLIGWAAAAALIAAVTAFVPPAGLALALLVAGVFAVLSVPAGRLGVAAAGVAVATAIAGPNLALPQAPEVFLFRIVIVLLVAGVAAHMAAGGTLAWPTSLSLPASLLGVWLLWSAASLAWAESVVAAARWSTYLALGITLALTVPIAFGTRRRSIGLMKLLGAAFVLVVLVSAAEILLNVRLPTSRLAGKAADATFAATSFFGNENNLATYLTLTLPYFLALALVFRDVRLRAVGVAGGLTCLMLLLYTGSKANLVATALVLVALLANLATDVRERRRALQAVAVVVGAVLLVVPAVLGSGLIKLPERAVSKFSFSILSEQVQSGQGSGAVRSNLLGDGLALVRDTGGIGVGAGNADVHIKSLADFPGVSNLHNWWLEVVVNGGLIGLGLYVCFYLFLYHRQVKATREARDPLVRYFALAGMAALTGFLIGCLGPSSVLAFAPMWITFGLCLVTVVLAARADANGGRLP